MEGDSRILDTREAALALFMKFVWAFADGTHSVKDRAAWLKG